MGRSPILQTHVGDPDRLSNRGVFPGGPKVFKILVRIDVLCPKGTQASVRALEK